eukprot:11228304-Lingulodinium_polyedra.AAC.1
MLRKLLVVVAISELECVAALTVKSSLLMNLTKTPCCACIANVYRKADGTKIYECDDKNFDPVMLSNKCNRCPKDLYWNANEKGKPYAMRADVAFPKQFLTDEWRYDRKFKGQSEPWSGLKQMELCIGEANTCAMEEYGPRGPTGNWRFGHKVSHKYWVNHANWDDCPTAYGANADCAGKPGTPRIDN